MKHFSRVLCALTLCTGFVLLSCEKTNQESGEDAQNSQDDVQNNQEKPVVFPLATDLSSSASANCYIISVPGFYKFKTVTGNSSESVGEVSSAEVLWESFGTETQPAIGDIIKSASYEDGYVAFQTPDLYKEGNAVIAVKNAESNILWSYHIWLTDAPQGQEYFNNAGIMMDRNLGATSSIPGDSGTIGLHYQWGRKDPFLGSTSITSASVAKSTITWPEAVESDSTYGTIEYATANPTVFILGDNPTNKDWYYTGARNTDHTRWTSSKTIYDPCPAGWRVPDGHQYGVWAKAIGTYESFEYAFDGDNKGMNLSGKYGSDATIWYPAAGYYADGKLMYVSTLGGAWSISPTNSYTEFCLYIQNSGKVYPAISAFRAYGMNVRCIQE